MWLCVVQIAPQGDPSQLSTVLDDPNVNVTMLLPTEPVLQEVFTRLTQGAPNLNNAAVQVSYISCVHDHDQSCLSLWFSSVCRRSFFLPSATDEAVLDLQTHVYVQEILLNHVLPTALDSLDLLELGDGGLDTVSGEIIEMMIDGQSIMLTLGNTTVTVVEPDLDGCAGDSVIHRIDGIFADGSLTAVSPTGVVDATGPVTPEEGAAPFLSMSVPSVIAVLSAAVLLL
jgi:hypothetical protein